MKKEHILVIRFSAMGDVAMMVPVVYSLAHQYPDIRITVLSRAFARSFFEDLAPNVGFMVADLKNEYNKTAQRKVFMQLSIGGWGSGRFSEMVTDTAYRHAFVAACKKVVEDYGIDGIDLDWEYPSSGVAGISSAPTDIDNFTLWVKELREALGQDKLLTIATISSDERDDCLRRFAKVFF